MAHTVDFDLHGVVGIRVLDAGRQELDAIRRQLGPIERSLKARAPDIVIRFSRMPSEPSDLRHITLGHTAHDPRHYYVLRDDRGRQTMTSLPMRDVGGPCEIACSRGTRGIRTLLAVINLTALWKGLVPLHGSGLIHEGRGVLVTGWAKGGKTETLLAFREQGARYVADEWVYLDPETQRMYGIPEPIRLWAWHLRDLPSLRATVSPRTWRRLQLGHWGAMLAGRLTPAAEVSGSGLGRMLRKAVPSLQRQLSVQVEPARLFGEPRMATGGAAVRQLLWAVSHGSEEIRVEDIDASVVAQRMSASVEFELAELREHYLQFRYAFPGTTNHRIEGIGPRLADLLGEALSPLDAYLVAHPYPVDLNQLYRAIADRLAPRGP